VPEKVRLNGTMSRRKSCKSHKDQLGPPDVTLKRKKKKIWGKARPDPLRGGIWDRKKEKGVYLGDLITSDIKSPREADA